MKAIALLTALWLSFGAAANALPPIKGADTITIKGDKTLSSVTKGSGASKIGAKSSTGLVPSNKLESSILQLSVNHKMLGDGTLLVGSKNLLFHVNRSDLSFCMTNSGKKVITFCRQSGKYYEVATDKFINPYSKSRAIIYGVSYKYIPMQLTGHEALLGINTDVYNCTQAYSAEMREKYKKREMAENQPEKCRGNYLKLAVEPAVLKLVNDLLAAPEVRQSMCLKLDIEQLDKGKMPYLSVSKISTLKMNDQTMHMFDVPSGLKRVANPEEVVQNEASGEAIRMMLEGGNHENYK